MANFDALLDSRPDLEDAVAKTTSSNEEWALKRNSCSSPEPNRNWGEHHVKITRDSIPTPYGEGVRNQQVRTERLEQSTTPTITITQKSPTKEVRAR